MSFFIVYALLECDAKYEKSKPYFSENTPVMPDPILLNVRACPFDCFFFDT